MTNIKKYKRPYTTQALNPVREAKKTLVSSNKLIVFLLTLTSKNIIIPDKTKALVVSFFIQKNLNSFKANKTPISTTTIFVLPQNLLRPKKNNKAKPPPMNSIRLKKLIPSTGLIRGRGAFKCLIVPILKHLHKL